MYAKEYFHPFNPTPLRGKPFIIVGPSGVGKNAACPPGRGGQDCVRFAYAIAKMMK